MYNFKNANVDENVEFVCFNRMKTPGVRVEARYAFEFMKETGAKPTNIIFRESTNETQGKHAVCNLNAKGDKIIASDGSNWVFVEKNQ